MRQATELSPEALVDRHHLDLAEAAAGNAADRAADEIGVIVGTVRMTLTRGAGRSGPKLTTGSVVHHPRSSSRWCSRSCTRTIRRSQPRAAHGVFLPRRFQSFRERHLRHRLGAGAERARSGPGRHATAAEKRCEVRSAGISSRLNELVGFPSHFAHPFGIFEQSAEDLRQLPVVGGDVVLTRDQRLDLNAMLGDDYATVHPAPQHPVPLQGRRCDDVQHQLGAQALPLVPPRPAMLSLSVSLITDRRPSR